MSRNRYRYRYRCHEYIAHKHFGCRPTEIDRFAFVVLAGRVTQ